MIWKQVYYDIMDALWHFVEFSLFTGRIGSTAASRAIGLRDVLTEEINITHLLFKL